MYDRLPRRHARYSLLRSAQKLYSQEVNELCIILMAYASNREWTLYILPIVNSQVSVRQKGRGHINEESQATYSGGPSGKLPSAVLSWHYLQELYKLHIRKYVPLNGLIILIWCRRFSWCHAHLMTRTWRKSRRRPEHTHLLPSKHAGQW